MSPGILDEISLWRHVQFVDISTEILFEPHKTTKRRLGLDDLNLQFLILGIFEYMFKEDKMNNSEEDGVIYVENGFLFGKELLGLGHDDLKGPGFEIRSKASINRELSEMRLITDASSIASPATAPVKPQIKLSTVGSSTKWKCSIRIREELVFSKLIKRSTESPIVQSSKKRVALLIPSKTIDSIKDIGKSPLAELFIPSFVKSKISDLDVKIFVGYDSGDILGELSNQEKLRGMLDVTMEFVEFPRTNWVTFIWNSLYALAMRDGFDYFVQVNDDVRVKSSTWLESSILVLNENAPTGVVGLFDAFFKCSLFTQSMANRAHYKYFSGHYYPLGFKNWYSDKWITHVYGYKSVCNRDAKVENRMEGSPRYSPCSNEKEYRKILLESKLVLEGFLKKEPK